MEILSEPRVPGGVPAPVSVAIGVFDGVHLGHQAVVRRMVEAAGRHGARAVAVTFDPHPAAVLAHQHAPPAIQRIAQRLRSLAALGVDATWLIRFDESFSRQSGETFVNRLAGGFGALRSVHIGRGFTFGHRRSGNVALLQQLGAAGGFTVDPVEPVHAHGGVVSSTRVRELIRRGELQTVAELLGRPYSVAGAVEAGERLGRRLGTPTANVNVDGLALPPLGVYAVQAIIEGTAWPAVANLGVRPTVSTGVEGVRLEAHLLDADEDLYGKEVEVRFHCRLRAEQRFDCVEALQAQIQADIRAARAALAAPAGG